jgi:putative nucleotidyltransferase with HDIG domain
MPGLSPIAEKSSSDLDSVVHRIDEISTLPAVALRLMEVAGDMSSSAADLKEVLESDTALCARVLRCVNSAAYAVRTKITDLQQAIAYLGLKQIRNLAMTASVSELFKTDATISSYTRAGLWKHLVSVGICARLIAKRRKMANFEDMFLAGLLHDIGIVLMDQSVHDQFSKIIVSLKGDKTLVQAEREHVGFDHAELGERVARNWGFPDAARAAIRYHHASANYKGSEIDVVRCVEIANLLCTLKGISSIGLKLVQLSKPAISGLRLTKEDIAILIEDLDGEIESNAGLFQI